MRSKCVPRITSIDHYDWSLRIRWQGFVDWVHVKLIVIVYFYQIFCIWLEVANQNRVDLSWSEPLELIVAETLGYLCREDVRLTCVKLLIVYSDIPFDICMSVNIEEESGGGIFGNCGISMARRTRRTGLFQFQPTSPICIDGWSKKVARIPNFIIIEGHTSFVEEQIPPHAQHHSEYDYFFIPTPSFEASIQKEQLISFILNQWFRLSVFSQKLHFDLSLVLSSCLLNAVVEVDSDHVDGKHTQNAFKDV